MDDQLNPGEEKDARGIGQLNPGNANLLIGKSIKANREIGVPREEESAPGVGVPREEESAPGVGESIKANQEIGDPREENSDRNIGIPREKKDVQETRDTVAPMWHSRGYLPHFDSGNEIQHVTWHLADSLPKEVALHMAEEFKALPKEKQGVEQRKRMEDWLDAGHGSCILKEPAAAEMVQNTFLFFDSIRYRLLAWVVMPNHVHVLFQPLDGWTVGKIVTAWKKFTARQICKYQRMDREKANLLIGKINPGNANNATGKVNPGNANLLIGKSIKANQEIGDPREENSDRGIGERVWHREYWDRYMRDEQHLAQAIEYIRQNPVKAGLVMKAEDWKWSSAFAGNANLLIGQLNPGEEKAAPGIGKLNPGEEKHARGMGPLNPGNANLLIGKNIKANQEIGDPREENSAPEIGQSIPGEEKSARNIGDPREES